ncbi:Alpha/Beta hydrolase protein [Elsinoe ampelina]|uniref:Alpha/Beta hydrolase protein n=1 Tax=Elsinoe ampelina TaxID=302913 RepID=A0A6A6GM46_9PEZI|nr:Alpha/Beta hydrolase protein [Elsinoe ampelina]
MPRPRWLLKLHARVMRFLMSMGMFIHKLLPPRPPPPAFQRLIPSTLSSNPGDLLVSVYTPPGYESRRRRSFRQDGHPELYKCIINYHGGGFTLGTSTDDARFIQHAINALGCVVVSVDYRLAPEHPFPTAVDDGADAVLWVAEHADELGIDPFSLTLSGFSSGGNLVLSVPIRLHDHLRSITRPLYTTSSPIPSPQGKTSLTISPLDANASTSSLSSTVAENIPLKSPSPLPRRAGPSKEPSFKIRALVPCYPSTNYALSRSVRRATNPNPAVDLPHSLTRLFDESYIPSASIRLENPYLSPGLLGKREMRDVYAGMRVVGVGCEYDMLCREGGEMMMRLVGTRRGEVEGDEDGEERETVTKVEEDGVSWRVVRGVRHGWDKRPFLSAGLRDGIEKEYAWVCRMISVALELDSAGLLE